MEQRVRGARGEKRGLQTEKKQQKQQGRQERGAQAARGVRGARGAQQGQNYSRSVRGLEELLKRLSFGMNGGRTPNTSTAVAYGLILNYFDRVSPKDILPGILKSEALRGSEWDAQRYPQTALLHGYLLNRARLKPSPLGRWGRNVVWRLQRFWRGNPWQTGVIVRNMFGGYGHRKAWRLIQEEIDANRPVMVTALYDRLKSRGELYHTMVVCGYRVDAQGRRDILVHSGQYEGGVKGSRAQLHYISVRHVICSYYFDVVLLP
ncbi:MAG: hypothetical protein LBH56_00020, partial [Coriobacteriales bacterium]|nr:hypothetical protein [Coriobacteriales bacterium]